MKVPQTTLEKPYIEFRFDKKGKINLSASSSWFGGKNSRFFCSDGSEGNSCNPVNLKEYIEAYNKKRIKSIEKEIQLLQKQLQLVKSQMDHQKINFK